MYSNFLYVHVWFLLITEDLILTVRGHRGHDHMVLVFTTTYAISAYHH
jgi:hypothetical protein